MVIDYETLCTECNHPADYHDGIGCNGEDANFNPCYCTTAMNFHTGDSEPGVFADD